MASLLGVNRCLAIAHCTSSTTIAHNTFMLGRARPAVHVSVLFPLADLGQPLHYDVCDLKIVLIKHHHVSITFDAVVRKQKKLSVTAGSLDRVDGGDAAISPSIPIGPQSTHGVVPPK